MKQRFIDRDVENLQADVMDYAMTHYEEELIDLLEEHMDTYGFSVRSPYEESYMSLFLPWAIFNKPMADDQTIFYHFMDKIGSGYRPVTREIIDKWETVPSVYELREHVGENRFFVKRAGSKQEFPVDLPEGDWPQQDCPLIGILVSAGDTWQFLMSFIEIPAENKMPILKWMQQKDAKTGQPLAKQQFPRILYDAFELANEEENGPFFPGNGRR